MIAIDRARAGADAQPIRPPANWTARARAQTAAAVAEGPGHQVSDLYRDAGVKAALEELFRDKCAYCETTGFAGFPWDVEHFRPKGSVAEDPAHPGYYWLAYAWENLYPSCVLCNQRRTDQPTYADPVAGPALGKADQFPVADEAQRARTPDDAISLETPLLLDPCSDQPEHHLRFDATGKVSARDGSAKGAATIRVFALNRRRLVNSRRAVLNEISSFIDNLVAKGMPREDANASVLDVVCQPQYRYSALALAVRADPVRFGL